MRSRLTIQHIAISATPLLPLVHIQYFPPCFNYLLHVFPFQISLINANSQLTAYFSYWSASSSRSFSTYSGKIIPQSKITFKGSEGWVPECLLCAKIPAGTEIEDEMLLATSIMSNMRRTNQEILGIRDQGVVPLIYSPPQCL